MHRVRVSGAHNNGVVLIPSLLPVGDKYLSNVCLSVKPDIADQIYSNFGEISIKSFHEASL